MYSTNSPPLQRPSYSTEKIEEDLVLHIKKACNADETAPKQKHVRACIVYTWDVKGSGGFWTGLKVLPLLGDEVMTFKCLITLHKVVRGGHPNVSIYISFLLYFFFFRIFFIIWSESESVSYLDNLLLLLLYGLIFFSFAFDYLIIRY